MTMNREKKGRFLRLFFFALTIAGAILVLRLLDWIPNAIEKSDLRSYESVDAAQAYLKESHIYLPSYFPDSIGWPPFQVFAQRKPFVLVITHFAHMSSKELALSIFQSELDGNYEPSLPLDTLYIKQKRDLAIKGVSGQLVKAVCSGQKTCNRLSWNYEGFSFFIVSDHDAEAIIRMAESMITR